MRKRNDLRTDRPWFMQSYTHGEQRFMFIWEGGFDHMEQALDRAIAAEQWGITYTYIPN